jgi:hypothetical protein
MQTARMQSQSECKACTRTTYPTCLTQTREASTSDDEDEDAEDAEGEDEDEEEDAEGEDEDGDEDGEDDDEEDDEGTDGEADGEDIEVDTVREAGAGRLLVRPANDSISRYLASADLYSPA